MKTRINFAPFKQFLDKSLRQKQNNQSEYKESKYSLWFCLDLSIHQSRHHMSRPHIVNQSRHHLQVCYHSIATFDDKVKYMKEQWKDEERQWSPLNASALQHPRVFVVLACLSQGNLLYLFIYLFVCLFVCLFIYLLTLKVLWQCLQPPFLNVHLTEIFYLKGLNHGVCWALWGSELSLLFTVFCSSSDFLSFALQLSSCYSMVMTSSPLPSQLLVYNSKLQQ